MSLVTWHPEESLTNFFDTGQFFNTKALRWQAKEAYLPKVNITETENSFFLEAETPGLKVKNINIEVLNGLLTIKGHTEDKSEKGKENYLIREFSSQNFERSFALNDRVDTEKVSAKIDNGILKVNLPKHDQVKPLKIEVQNKP